MMNHVKILLILACCSGTVFAVKDPFITHLEAIISPDDDRRVVVIHRQDGEPIRILNPHPQQEPPSGLDRTPPVLNRVTRNKRRRNTDDQNPRAKKRLTYPSGN